MKLNYTATPRIEDGAVLWIDEEHWSEGFPNGSALNDYIQSYATMCADTRNKAIREGLIALGWTPPQGEKQHE